MRDACQNSSRPVTVPGLSLVRQYKRLQVFALLRSMRARKLRPDVLLLAQVQEHLKA